ncbi:MAG: hypothetical protein GY861_27235 [bacterium]|nr:hypothetical protein [bacterium]
MSKTEITNSGSENSFDAKAVQQDTSESHHPEVGPVIAQVLKWQEGDDYAQAGIRYCRDKEFPDKHYLQTWIKTIGEQLELDENGILFR